MPVIKATLDIPEHILHGLLNGTYERFGGMIRTAGTKRIVAWLREGFGAAKSFLEIPRVTLPPELGTLSIGVGVLNLAITTMGFAMVMRHLKKIEGELAKAQEILQLIDHKIELSFYANARAALDLANNSLSMANPEVRRASALQAVSKFLEAEQHYSSLVDKEISAGSSVAKDYLSTLTLAYVTEARCYLELEEIDVAVQRLECGHSDLRSRTFDYLKKMLTTNPAAYLHPSLKGEISFKRFADVIRWLRPNQDDAAMFEFLRDYIFNLSLAQNAWISSLPPAIAFDEAALFELSKTNKKAYDVGKYLGRLLSRGDSDRVYQKLPPVLVAMEETIEEANRFEAYIEEIKLVRQLGMTFREWLAVSADLAANGHEASLVCITVGDQEAA